MAKKISLFILMYLLFGLLSIKLLTMHPESWLHNEDRPSELGVAVVMFPIMILFDGVINIGTYELGSLLINKP